MKVWINKRIGGYSGGMILVAANSAEEARRAFHDDPDFAHMWCRWGDYIDDDYYPSDGWEPMPLLDAKVKKPQVLAEAGYTE